MAHLVSEGNFVRSVHNKAGVGARGINHGAERGFVVHDTKPSRSGSGSGCVGVEE